MKDLQLRSDCPINYALATFGDAWSLLLVRDIVFWGKRSYKQFLASEEGIASNILADRLKHLVRQGVLEKVSNQRDGRTAVYQLTKKGLDLIPLLLEISVWACTYDPKTIMPRKFVRAVVRDRTKMVATTKSAVQHGSSLFGVTA